MTGSAQRHDDEKGGSRRWQLLAGVIVLLGCIATAGYAIVETFWG